MNDNISPEQQVDVSIQEHASKEPIQDEWTRRFPKTYQQAEDDLKQARGAYYGFVLPENVNTPNTSQQSLAGLLDAKAGEYQKTREYINKGSNWIPDVPSGFEEWAITKMGLAQEVWRASAARNIFVERFKDKVPAEATIRDGVWEEEAKEIVNVMTGRFRVAIVNGKPEMKTTSEEDLLREIVQSLEKRHTRWIEGHKNGFIAKHPLLSRSLEMLKTIVTELPRPGVLGDLLLDYYIVWLRKGTNQAQAQVKEQDHD